MSIKALTCVLLLAAAPAFADGVDGKWSGSIDTPNGPVQVNFLFKTAGKEVTGSSTGPDGNSVMLKNVKVEGDKISFSLDVNFGPEPTTFNYTGVVAGNEMKLHTDFMGQPIDYTVKKGP